MKAGKVRVIQGLFFLMMLFMFNPLAQAKALPLVWIVSTGGTIAEKINPKTGAAVPAVTGKDLIQAVPGLNQVARIKVFPLCNIDSSHMTPEIWRKLALKVNTLLAGPEVRGVVVTHGTDTMAEGAFFLELTVKPQKPVVFVGAMRNASELSPDGPANIMNAVIQVCSDEAAGWGTTVTLNNYINSAWYVKKTESTDVQTFESGPHGYLGTVVNARVQRYQDQDRVLKFPIPDTLPKVVALTTFAGDDGALIRHALKTGTKGLVVEGVGSGNVNPDVRAAIQQALDRDVPVVITTRVQWGGVVPEYGDVGGGADLKKLGAVLGGEIDTYKARLLLMLALAQPDFSKEQLQSYFIYEEWTR
ncbi:MAG: asparaginase [Deltaproteobacteria bacterium]|nr:asparaginase [Deltaproteobacteria bacterium]